MSMTIHVDDDDIGVAMFHSELSAPKVLYWFCREAEDEEHLVDALCASDLDETPARELGALLWRLFKDGALK